MERGLAIPVRQVGVGAHGAAEQLPHNIQMPCFYCQVQGGLVERLQRLPSDQPAAGAVLIGLEVLQVWVGALVLWCQGGVESKGRLEGLESARLEGAGAAQAVRWGQPGCRLRACLCRQAGRQVGGQGHQLPGAAHPKLPT